MPALPLRLLILVAAAAIGGCSASAGTRPVVVELFQSQGCSSCPPANANLSTVADKPGVIALNFSVTYWDDQHWKDNLRPAEVHRPAVGLRPRLRPGRCVHAANRGRWPPRRGWRRSGRLCPSGRQRRGGRRGGGPAIALTTGAASIGAGSKPAADADVWLVRYDPRILQVPIKGGENSGRTLPHEDIVRELVRLGGWNGLVETLPLPPATQPGLVAAVLVQSPHGGPILAAAKD
ncbi:MAG: DUF1223 domain-containing protein [Caulobacteraceae bacterium]